MLRNKRESILEAASASFSMYGYKGTTIDLVAKLAKIGKGTIYTEFKSKEELFDAVLQQIITELQLVFEKSTVPERDVYDNITYALYDLLEFRQQHHLLVKLSHEVTALGSTNAIEALQKVERVIIDCIKNHLEKGERLDNIGVVDSQVIAFIMYKLYMALVVEYSEIYDPLDKDQIIEIFRTQLTSGLLSNKRDLG
ncbi:TetR/AcrR family transcriptional regulator [Alkalihalobacillus sp. TS-13]|uniref:TetR/AcrR family transcriptional regulator n=1 Tax=Alkalihalobacillus sp. TS-13 TaxID=2842455 RepID=UPI001C883EC6|nr:TetR/AcrR family transcriptional regulator [Alkalihalobacillus sp. TS-13]